MISEPAGGFLQQSPGTQARHHALQPDEAQLVYNQQCRH